MAPNPAIVTAVVVLIRLSFLFGLLAFVTGGLGFGLAAIAVHTGSATDVRLPVYPIVHRRSRIPRDEEAVSVLEKRSSKLSLEL